MSLTIIVLLPVACGFGLLLWADQLDEMHGILKLMFQLAFIPLCFLSVHLAVIDATILYGANSDLVATLADFVFYLGWFLFIIGAYYVYVIFLAVKDWVAIRKQEREDSKYG